MSHTLDVRRDVSLRDLNTFGIDASASACVRVHSVADLQALRADPALSALPRLVLGGGSNLLLTRDVDGLVLHMTGTGIVIDGEDAQYRYVTAQAGENWHGFVRWTLAHGCPGLENLSLIPGTVGASPIQNIGAYGSELAEFVDAVTAFDFTTGEIFTLDAAACGFGYRDSIFKHALKDRAVICSVRYRLPKQWHSNLRYPELANEIAAQGIASPTAMQVSDAVIAIRRRKLPDPAQIGNAGSFFKNPVVSAATRDALLAQHPALVSYPQADGSCKLAAGWLIDQCGWKGKSLGAAGVHDRQALVLVNRGGATGAEVLALACRIVEDVQQRFGVTLEPEPVVA
ncbi:MAG: UDP-N-acetylmuramate dehydrogenase [Pseudomonadota bacterium]|jgi:UDP-N-acetylmuramate dehydrogenase